MIFELEKPKQPKEKMKELAMIFSHQKEEVLDFVKKIDSWDSGYMYFDKMKYKEPAPQGMSKESLWEIVKFSRHSRSLKTPIKDEDGNHFKWVKLDYFEEFFHELDMNTGGEVSLPKDGYRADSQRLIVRGIMEEAIASSQLEGAATSRQEAKKMLREQRRPTNQSEQMILNNYLIMKAIEGDYKDRRMDMDMIMDMHSLITKNTFDSQGEKPRLRNDNETVYINDDVNGIIYHKAPGVDFVKRELKELMCFANDEEENDSFIHPVIKAIMLHFWIGYLHPFTDGNGRLARSLFYWYLLKKGYWGFSYLPVSKNIKRSVKRYIMSYVYSEQDDNDLTYFLDYNIRKIRLAIDEFDTYLKQQAEKNSDMKKGVTERYGFNERQIQLLQYLHGDQGGRTNLKTHMHINGVSKMTAINDLKSLLEEGFLASVKQGRNVYYSSTEKVNKLFK
ncbi:MAG: Fic family protein [Candidatus Pacebacteria bacterium]|nr:Fic family protein [Candidatus Paceibacterota bacterium]